MHLFRSYEFCRHRPEFLQRCFQAIDDFGGQLRGRGQTVGVCRVGVLQPEQVQVELVALGQFLIAEALEPFALLSVVALVFGAINREQVV